MNFEAESQEFAKILRSLEQFIQIVKGQKHIQEKLDIDIFDIDLGVKRLFGFIKRHVTKKYTQ